MKPWLFALINGRRLRTQTLTTNGGWTVPPGVTSVNLSGHGSNGTPDADGEEIIASFHFVGLHFPGGAAGSFAPVTTYNNVAVVPDENEPMLIPAGGALTITWYQ